MDEGGGRRQNASHISYKDETWHSYPLPKKIQKIFKSSDTPLGFCWHQHFYNGNQQLVLYEETQVYIAF